MEGWKEGGREGVSERGREGGSGGGGGRSKRVRVGLSNKEGGRATRSGEGGREGGRYLGFRIWRATSRRTCGRSEGGHHQAVHPCLPPPPTYPPHPTQTLCCVCSRPHVLRRTARSAVAVGVSGFQGVSGPLSDADIHTLNFLASTRSCADARGLGFLTPGRPSCGRLGAPWWAWS